MAPSPASPQRLAADRVVAAIPARWASTRLPGKPLLELAGRPMIRHVVERVWRAGLERVVVLTDDARVVAAVEAFGGEALLTPADCASGTDRIALAARNWSAEAIVNVQGDEPLVDPATVRRVAEHLLAHPQDPMVTVATPAAEEDLADPHAVKVVTDRGGLALYFSRSPIPFRRGPGGFAPLRHLGLYGYRREILLRLAGLAPSPLERSESLEQLRALEHGVAIRVLEVAGAAPGVDTPDDARRAEGLLRGFGEPGRR